MSEQIVKQEASEAPLIMIPIIEGDVVIPKSQSASFPPMTAEKEIEIRSQTIKTLADIKQEPITPSKSDVKQAEEIVGEMISNPAFKPEFGSYPNETMAYLAGMVAQSNCMLVKDMADYKLYVLNNAVKVHESTDNPKEKLLALRMIGEVDGVDAFKKKTEVTHINRTGKELEEELLKTIEDLKGKVVEGVEYETIEDEDEDD